MCYLASLSIRMLIEPMIRPDFPALPNAVHWYRHQIGPSKRGSPFWLDLIVEHVEDRKSPHSTCICTFMHYCYLSISTLVHVYVPSCYHLRGPCTCYTMASHGTLKRWYLKTPCAQMCPLSWNPSMSEKLSENLCKWSNDR